MFRVARHTKKKGGLFGAALVQSCCLVDYLTNTCRTAVTVCPFDP
jgi:hypothetical protein